MFSASASRLHSLLLAVAAASNVAAQQPPPASAPAEDIEEIDVIGQRTSISLGVEIRHLEEEMFELFNDLNSTDDFDVACGNVTPTGSKLPRWQCDVAYMRDAETRETQNFLQFGSLPLTREQLAFLHREKAEQMNAEMKALALQHPELASTMLTLHAKRQQLERMQEERKQSSAIGRFFNRLGGEKTGE